MSKPTEGMAEIVAKPATAEPRLPDGFSAKMVATSDLHKPRVVRVAPNGDLFVADSMFGAVHVLRLPAGRATPEKDVVFASGLKQPYGIAFYPLGPNPQWVYVANSDGVVRFRYQNGDLEATGQPERIIEGIPETHHYARDIVFSPDGSRLFLSVGSGSNVAMDMFPEPHWTMIPEPRNVDGVTEWAKTKPLGAAWDTEELRANVLSFDPNGKNMKIVATGLRNCAGMTVQPVTGQLWCAVNERDELGDNTPFEYATHVVEGAFYGWPWYFIGGHEDPRQAGARTDLRDKVTVPDVLMQAHSAPLQMAFYERDSFPAEYRGSAFVTMHGSWNRSQRTGYKVVRLLFDGSGRPTGEYEDFMTGFVVSDSQVWGRPVGVAVASDGSLLVTEDGNGTIWRVTYQRNVNKS
jgi:glucose/arabinose dehydrogenase